MTDVPVLDAKLISEILDKLATRLCVLATFAETMSDKFTASICNLTTFAENQNTLNAALMAKLKCIPQLIQKVKLLEAKNISLVTENLRLSNAIYNIKCNAIQDGKVKNTGGDNVNAQSSFFARNHVAGNNKCESLRRTELIISGIPDKAIDSPLNIAKRVLDSLGTSSTSSEIVSARFISEKCNSLEKETSKAIAKPHVRKRRALIVEVNSTSTLDLVLDKKRANHKLSTRDVFGNGPDQLLYVNELLSPEKYMLFRQARFIAKSAKYKYVWLNHGKIAMKGGEGHPVSFINSHDDLAKLQST